MRREGQRVLFFIREGTGMVCGDVLGWGEDTKVMGGEGLP